jgi:hypothetical protein
MRYVVAALIALLIVLHQDFWNWHTYEPLVLGFIPVGLAWHVGISLAAAVVAFLAVRYCWPEGLDPAATDGPSPRKGS